MTTPADLIPDLLPARLVRIGLRIFERLEEGLLLVALGLIIGLSCLQILLRNFGVAGFTWTDPFLRFMVLWIAMLGAMVATRHYNHITVDVLAAFVKSSWRYYVRTATDLFSAGVCGLLSYAGYLFIVDEKASQAVAFGQVPTWVAELIIPIAFAVMTARFATYAVVHLMVAMGKIELPKEPPGEGNETDSPQGDIRPPDTPQLDTTQPDGQPEASQPDADGGSTP